MKMKFGYEVTQRATGTPAAEKKVENHRENNSNSLWFSI